MQGVKRIFCVAILTCLLTGCAWGGDSTTPDEEGTVFGIGDHLYQVVIPDDWQRIESPTSSEAILLARSGMTNVALTSHNGVSANMTDALWEGAQEEFFYFAAGKKDDLEFDFLAKKSPEDPLRHYYQKILFAGKADYFLLLSCSHPDFIDGEDLCKDMRDSFHEVVMPTEESDTDDGTPEK